MTKRLAVLVAFLISVCAVVPLLGTPSRSTAATPLFGRVHDTYDPSKGKIFVLAIGNDARSGNPDRSLADAIHIIGVNTKTMKGGVLNLPRDSWVSIPGQGSAKINEALFRGGPELLARTVENLTGIHLDYWVMVGFEGFENIVTQLHGVEMNIPTAVNDIGASGALLRAGRQKLKGYQALAYARARKAFRGGDIARTTHQGDILVALLRKLRKETSASPASLLRWVAVTREQARFDMTPEEMFRLGIVATQLKAKDVGNVTVPASLGWVGPASVVHIGPGAQSIYQRFRENGSL
ncbi:MAG: LCP family protein [Actinomycetota bacterium]|nr:LCP family protein [Actinomycetota bacterium]